MKTIALFSTFFITQFSFGQIVAMPEYLVFHRGYDNIIEAASQNGVRRIELSSKDIAFIRIDGSSKNYLAKAIVVNNVEQTTIYMYNKRNCRNIDSFTVRIKQLPMPQLYFGETEPGNILTKNEDQFTVKYSPNLILHAQFQLISGTIQLPNGSTLYFSDKKIREEDLRTIHQLEKGSTIWVEAYTIGPDGFWRIVKSTYQI